MICYRKDTQQHGIYLLIGFTDPKKEYKAILKKIIIAIKKIDILFPVWRQKSFGLVVTGQAMNPALNEDKPELGILVLDKSTIQYNSSQLTKDF